VYGPLNRWQLYTAEDTKREMQQLLGKTRKLTGRPNKQPSYNCPNGCLIPISFS
jgi:hypothetical protein